MGNCCSDTVQTRYEVGNAQQSSRSQQEREADEAVALLSGSMAFSTWVEVRIALKNLKDADSFSAPDPMAVLYQLEGNNWREVSRTECIANTYSPAFVKPFKLLYNFERLQHMRVVVVDIDKGHDAAKVDPSKCDFIGQLEFKLSELITARGKQLDITLDGRGRAAGQATLIAEEQASSKQTIHMVLEAQGLTNVEVLSKSDPFLEISRLQEDGATWLPVYKTEVISNNLNPKWRQINIGAAQLCNADMYRPLKLRVMDYESSGRHQLIGEAQTTAEKLSQAVDGSKIALAHPSKPNQSAGYVLVRSFTQTYIPTFLDYIQGGVEINFMVAVDFTASNGEPRQPGSLHYLDPSGGPTQYEHAIMGVGRVLEFYDADRQFPMYGFGGRMPNNSVSHCFPLTGDPSNPAAVGVPGMLQTYRAALQRFPLSGPTLFAPVINSAAAWASQPSPVPRYYCLLIMTDGVIMDMPDTVAALVKASQLPLSVMIVGIGNEDFSNMEVLDGDSKRLGSPAAGYAERDIVQFVSFNRFASDGNALAAQLLAELPGQFLSYMRSRNIPVPAAAAVPPR